MFPLELCEDKLRVPGLLRTIDVRIEAALPAGVTVLQEKQ
jgi:hypothetical protein